MPIDNKSLEIDGRAFEKQSMLVTDSRTHDSILGKNWLAKHDVWLDLWNHRLIWPEEHVKLAANGAQEPAITPIW